MNNKKIDIKGFEILNQIPSDDVEKIIETLRAFDKEFMKGNYVKSLSAAWTTLKIWTNIVLNKSVEVYAKELLDIDLPYIARAIKQLEEIEELLKLNITSSKYLEIEARKARMNLHIMLTDSAEEDFLEYSEYGDLSKSLITNKGSVIGQSVIGTMSKKIFINYFGRFDEINIASKMVEESNGEISLATAKVQSSLGRKIFKSGLEQLALSEILQSTNAVSKDIKEKAFELIKKENYE